MDLTRGRPKPIKIRPGRPVPDPKKITWKKVGKEIHIFVETLDEELKIFLTQAIKRGRRMVGMNPDAVRITRYMVS